jgi:hypothetical protein
MSMAEGNESKLKNDNLIREKTGAARHTLQL